MTTPSNDWQAPDFAPHPYWWDASPPEDDAGQALPRGVDVLVVGAGYTGLHAAVRTARAGLSTLVLDAQSPGAGCSTRNGGQVSTSIKPGYDALARRYGDASAKGILAAGAASLGYIADFVRDERIDCGWAFVGRFHAAHSARAYERLAAAIDAPNPVFDDGAYLMPRADQAFETGSAAYHGGAVYPHHASVDAGRYHAGCLRVAREAGAQVTGHCRVNALTRSGSGFVVTTARGEVRAGQVIVATNGHTSELTPWLRRRVIPIGSYVIATESLPDNLMSEVMPTNRVLSDTRRLVYYYRPSPDRRRILFGGRVSIAETDPMRTAPKLLAELRRLYPVLRGTRVSRAWGGFVAYTFDTLAHCGTRDGLHYALGYCGSGVGMASYLGACIGRRVAGEPIDHPLAAIDFPTRPGYTGKPWFLAPTVALYRLTDRLG